MALPVASSSALKDMAYQLALMLNTGGVKGREAWENLHVKLADLATSIADTTVSFEALLNKLKETGSLVLCYPDAQVLLRQMMEHVEEKVSAQRAADASQAIPLLKNLILLVAGPLDMTPLCDSVYVEMIDGDAAFKQQEVDYMVSSSVELSDPNTPYTVVSIVGVQSSGKSFLLNQLFGTKFPVMDRCRGWHQTTRGIQISRCIEPSMLVLDTEGFDGRTRGEDASFEKQVTLFALTVSDIMMINISIFEIGRETGGGTSLWRTICQEREKLPPGLTNIVVVVRLRDQETPLDLLRKDVIDKFKQIWSRMCRESRKFTEYFQINVVALPDMDSEDFLKEVTALRMLLTNFTSSGKFPTSSFSLASKMLWDQIKQKKKLDLPTHMILPAKLPQKLPNQETISDFEKTEGDSNIILRAKLSQKGPDSERISYFKKREGDSNMILPAKLSQKEPDPETISNYKKIEGDSSMILPAKLSQKETEPETISDFEKREGDSNMILPAKLFQKEPDPETITVFEKRECDSNMLMASTVPPPNRVKLLYEGHQILNAIFGIIIGSIALLRWYRGRAEFSRTAIVLCLVDSIVLVLLYVLPQFIISRYCFFRKGSCVGLEACIWTGAMVLDHYVALLMINIEYIRIGLIPVIILVFIVTLGWQLRERGTVKVGSSEQEHDRVNNDKLELFDFVSYHLLLSFLTWTQYKGRQGCTPVLSDFLLFLGSALGALETMLASPLAGVNSRTVSAEVVPVLHKTRIVVLFIAVHTLAAEWLGDDMIYVCLPELITVLVWFTVCFGESTSVRSLTSYKSQGTIVSSVVAILACLIPWNGDGMAQLFSISISSLAFSQFHVWLLQGWPGSSSESNKLICLLNVSRTVCISTTAAISCVYMLVTDPWIMYDAIYNFEHKAMAAIVAIIFLLSFLVWSVHCRPGHPETQIKKIPVTQKPLDMLENKSHPKLDKGLEAHQDTMTSGVPEDVPVLQTKLKDWHSVINKMTVDKVRTPPLP